MESRSQPRPRSRPPRKGTVKKAEATQQRTAGAGVRAPGDLVVMGQVLAPYGVRGWLKARSFTASREGLLAYQAWWLAKDDGAWREFTVIEARPHADTLVARLDGFAAREQVARWCGATIAVPRATLPPLDAGEVYLADLIGLTVVSRAGAVLGRVTGLLETGVHPVLRVTREGSDERLIPLVPAYVDAIELGSARIVVDWSLDY